MFRNEFIVLIVIGFLYLAAEEFLTGNWRLGTISFGLAVVNGLIFCDA